MVYSLNSELEKTHAQRNKLQTKLDQATSEIKSAQSQLEDKQSRPVGMQSELENAKQAADQTKARATELANGPPVSIPAPLDWLLRCVGGMSALPPIADRFDSGERFSANVQPPF